MQRATPGPGLEFRLKDVSLVDQSGDPIIEAPSASIGLSVRALVQFHPAVEHVDLIGPRLFLQFSEQDGLALAFSKDTRANPDAVSESKGEAGGAGGAGCAARLDPLRGTIAWRRPASSQAAP